MEAGLRFGQALAAWNCAYLGARGGMEQESIDECLAHVSRILEGRGPDAATANKTKAAPPVDNSWCPGCSEAQTPPAPPAQRPKRTTA
jgi:fructokinase